MERLLQGIQGSIQTRHTRNGARSGTAVLDPAPDDEGGLVARFDDLVGRCLSADSAAFVNLVRQESGE